jgi:hypothetical protein
VTRGAALLVDPRDVPGWTTVLANVLADRALSDGLARAGAEAARSVTWRRGASALRSLLADVAAGRLLPERDISPPDPLTAPGAAARAR